MVKKVGRDTGNGVIHLQLAADVMDEILKARFAVLDNGFFPKHGVEIFGNDRPVLGGQEFKLFVGEQLNDRIGFLKPGEAGRDLKAGLSLGNGQDISIVLFVIQKNAGMLDPDFPHDHPDNEPDQGRRGMDEDHALAGVLELFFVIDAKVHAMGGIAGLGGRIMFGGFSVHRHLKF